MSSWRLQSAAEQVAAHLAAELAAGRWTGQMAGIISLASELGVSRNTIEAALRQLEKEGLLVPQGAGRRRQIPKSAGGPQAHPLRVALLVGESADRRPDYVVDLQHRLAEAGHEVFHTAKTLADLGMNVRRVARLVRETNADAWVVHAASREVLEWFAAQPLPVLALFGRRGQLPIAGIGPDKLPALAEATRALIGLGHRRIVLLTRRRRRLPIPGAVERGFLKELEAGGIPTGDYNLPDWEESVEGFHARLHSLFRLTPPTALVLDEPPFVTAALQFCCSRYLRVPEDVSLICADPDPNFDWCQPSVAHIRWDSSMVARRIVRWASNVSHGKRDVRQTLIKAEFANGGTVGPAAV